MSTRWRRGQAGDATPRELPTSLAPESDDEAGQMIAVSQQCRRTRMNTHLNTHTHECINTHKLRARQSRLSTSVPLQDPDVLQSQIESADTHSLTRTHTKLPHKCTHTSSHALSYSHSCTLLHSDTLIQRSFFWGHCLKARGVGRSGE